MRVLMYLPGFRPGSPGQIVYADFAAAVRERRIDFELVTDRPVGGGEPEPIGFGSVVPRRRPALDRLLAPFTRSGRFLEHVATIGRLIDERRPDLIYMEQVYPLGAAAWLALRLRRSPIPLVVMPSGEDVLMEPDAAFGFRRFALPRWLVGRTLAEAAGVRCISPLIERTVGPQSRGVRALVPASVAGATVERARLGEGERGRPRERGRPTLDPGRLPTGRHLVVGMGRLHSIKGFDRLIAAVSELPDVGLLLVGKSLEVAGYGDTGRWLDGLAREAGLGERYRRVGWVEHDAVLDLLAAADVVAAPSLVESQNRICVEAAAVGTPFVVGAGAGVAGLIDEEGVGIIVPSGEVAPLREAIRRQLPGGGWSRDEHACRRWVERFAPAAAAAGVARLFAAVTERAASGARTLDEEVET